MSRITLKSLRISGFKSFASPATINFGPGITAIVGPNGSGKSNLADAVAWVLGAQGHKALRAERMADVVFSGTDKRPPLRRAEVRLVLLDPDNEIGLGLSEVSLTRVVYRDGEAEYRINEASCRLSDVMDLLAEIGLGRQRHSLVGQGQVADLVAASAAERRNVLEEAAGIQRHRYRQERAQRLLAAAEADLAEALKREADLRRRIRPLTRQARSAARQQELLGRREYLSQALHVAAARRLEGDVARMTTEVSAARSHLESCEAELGQLASRSAAIEAKLNELAGDATRTYQVEADSLIRRHRELADRLARLIRECESTLAQDASQLSSKGLDPTPALDLERSVILAEAREQILAVETELDRAAAGTADPTAGLEALQRELEAGRRAEELARAELADLAAQRNQADRARLAAEQAAEKVAAELTALVDQLPGVRAGLDAVAKRLATGEAAEAALVVRQSSLTERVAAASTELAAARAEHAVAAAELAGLNSLLAQRAELLGLEELSAVAGVVGVLEDLLEIDPAHEPALLAALGDWIRAIVVESDEALSAVLSLMAERGQGGTVVSLAQPADSAQLPGWIFLKDARLASPLSHLLVGALADHPGRPAGTWVRSGLYRLAPAGAQVAIGARLEPARGRLARAEADLAERDQDLVELRAAEKACQAELSRVRGDLAKLRSEFTGGEGHRQRIEAALAAAQRIHQERKASTVEHALELARLDPLVEAARRRVDELTTARQVVEAGLVERRRDFERVRLRVSLARERRHRSHRAAEQAQADRARATGRFAAAKAAYAGQRRAEARAEAEAARSRVRLAAAVRLRSVLEGWARRAEVVSGHLGRQAQGQAEHRQSLLREWEQVRQAASRRQAELAGLTQALGRAQSDLITTQSRLAEHTGLITRADLEIEGGLAGEAELMDELAAVEKELAGLGPVNQLAAEELADLNQELRRLALDVADLTAARASAEEALAELAARIDSEFREFVARVSAHYERVVAQLLPGGSGRLRLAEEADGEPGVEIEATPAGKRVKRLAQLSGGERSLVALAFLFAIFMTEPSPFYLLDEVEAALDDASLGRFLAVASAVAESSQILLVTHQRRTMESAACLVGVTMAPGDGSRILIERIGDRPGPAGPEAKVTLSN